jgi:HKD family nuclease
MKINHFTQKTIVGPHSEIIGQLNNCKNFCIATAFIDSFAIELLEGCLQNNSDLQSAKLLIGTYGYFNKKSNIQRLKKLAIKYASVMQVHISRSHYFHWKYFQFNTGTNRISYLGSANFTESGLLKNEEILIKLQNPLISNDKSLKNLEYSFEKEWSNSGSISEFKIDLYPDRTITEISQKEVNPTFLKFYEKLKFEETTEIESNKAVVIFFDEYMKNESVKKVVNYNNGWSNKDFFACLKRPFFEQCVKHKRLFIIDKQSKIIKCFWAHTLEYSNDIPTKHDGRYFISYKIDSTKQLITDKEINFLKNSLGISIKYRGTKFKYKVIGSKQLIQLEQNIKTRSLKKNKL